MIRQKQQELEALENDLKRSNDFLPPEAVIKKYSLP